MSLSTRMKLRIFLTLLAVLLSANGLALEWPQEIIGDQGTITIYQPQPESLTGNNLKARSAMSFQLKDAGEQQFSAAVENAAEGHQFEISMDELSARYWQVSVFRLPKCEVDSQATALLHSLNALTLRLR